MQESAQNIACVFSFDDAYAIPFQVFFHSLEATKSIPPEIKIYILHTASLSLEAIRAIKLFLTRYQRNAVFLDASNAVPDQLPIRDGDHISAATFYRLFIAEILPETITHAVYFDSDMLAIRSVRPLFAEPINAMVAAVDHYSPANAIRLWGPKGGTYFQAGVLAIPLKRWREQQLASTFRNAIKTEWNRLHWHDQDLLNIILKDKFDRLPIGYNLETATSKQLPQHMVAQQASLIHFSGPWKPWNTFSFAPYFDDWDKNYQAVFGHPFDRRALLPPKHKRLIHAFTSRIRGLIHGRD
jgi:lipopolysaccharide biosynthesis glycosyltransferase